MKKQPARANSAALASLSQCGRTSTTATAAGGGSWHEAGGGAERGGEPGAGGDRPAGADPAQSGRRRVQRGVARRQSQLRGPEEEPEQEHRKQRDGDDSEVGDREGDSGEP